MATSKTAWSKSASSFPSDRIRPAHTQPPTKRKGKGSSGPVEPAKSKEIIQLEALLKHVRDYTGRDKDPKGGCFCQAREHLLSPYTPICRSCGLILCTINPPHFVCPHCSTGLLPTPAMREKIVVQLETRIAETVAKEAEAKQRAEEEARLAAGAFPTLAASSASTIQPSAQSLVKGSASSGSLLRPSTNEPHKVLSLNSKTKKVIVSSYNSSPATSRPASRSSVENEEEIYRVPPPPAEVSYVRQRPDPARPWVNLASDPITYVPPAKDIPRDDEKKRRKKVKHESSDNEPGSQKRSPGSKR